MMRSMGEKGRAFDRALRLMWSPRDAPSSASTAERFDRELRELWRPTPDVRGKTSRRRGAR